MSRENYSLYRVLGAQKMDKWYYEDGDLRRTHRHVYELFILPFYGICENSFLDYRHNTDEFLELYNQPLYIEVPLWLSVMTVKNMSVQEANRFFDIIRKRLEYIFKNSAKPLNADQLIKILVQLLTELQPG